MFKIQVSILKLNFKKAFAVVGATLVLCGPQLSKAAENCSDLFLPSVEKTISESEEKAQNIFAAIQSLTKTSAYRSDMDILELYRQSIMIARDGLANFLQNRENYPQELLNTKSALDARKLMIAMNADLVKVARFAKGEKALSDKISKSFERRTVGEIVDDVRHQNWTIRQQLVAIEIENRLLQAKGEELVKLVTAISFEREYTQNLIEQLQNEAYQTRNKTEEDKAFETDILRQISKISQDLSEMVTMASNLDLSIGSAITNNLSAIEEVASGVDKQIAATAVSSGQTINLSPKEKAELVAEAKAAVTKGPSIAERLNSAKWEVKNFYRDRISPHKFKIVFAGLILSGFAWSVDIIHTEGQIEKWQQGKTSVNFSQLSNSDIEKYLEYSVGPTSRGDRLHDLVEIAGAYGAPLSNVAEVMLRRTYNTTSNQDNYDSALKYTKIFFSHQSLAKASETDLKHLLDAAYMYRHADDQLVDILNSVADYRKFFPDKKVNVYDLMKTTYEIADFYRDSMTNDRIEFTYKTLLHMSYYDDISPSEIKQKIMPMMRQTKDVTDFLTELDTLERYSTQHDYGLKTYGYSKKLTFDQVLTVVQQLNEQAVPRAELTPKAGEILLGIKK